MLPVLNSPVFVNLFQNTDGGVSVCISRVTWATNAHTHLLLPTAREWATLRSVWGNVCLREWAILRSVWGLFLGLFEDYGAGSVYRHKQAFLTCSSVYWQPVSSGWALKELMPPSGNSGIRGMGGWGSHILRGTIRTGTYLHQEGGVYICVKTSSIWRIRERALSELMLQTLTSMRKDGSTLYWSCRIPLRPSRSEDRRSSWSELQMRN